MTCIFLETVAEVIDVIETDLIGDLIDLIIAEFQQFLGFLHAGLDQILIEGRIQDLFKQSAQIRDADAQIFTDEVHRNVRIGIVGV